MAKCLGGLIVLLMISDGWSAPPAAWYSQLAKVRPAEDAIAGEWSVSSDGLGTNAVAGSRLGLPAKVPREYDFRVRFTRHSGQHSIAIFFTSGTGRASFEIDAWGQHLAGIQNVGGQTFQQNPTRANNFSLQNGRTYTAELRVRSDSVSALLDDKPISTYRGDGSDLSLYPAWSLPSEFQLGVGAYEAEATFHEIELRVVSSSTTASPVAMSAPRQVAMNNSGNQVTETPHKSNERGRVLLVIANRDFFYREYADPKQELEKAGLIVEVAAGHSVDCYPHPNSGQTGSGAIKPDLMLSQVDPNRYQAIVFSGGWGSSMYQFAFPGRYDQADYNGDAQTKETVNRLINEFAEQDKYICGICNAVSVLSWSRVNGRSLLAGKTVTAPSRPAPNGMYNGRHDAPSIHWHIQQNDGKLVPPGSIGNPRSTEDDVVVDGKIMTAEDDHSAREVGRRLASLLLSN